MIRQTYLVTQDDYVKSMETTAHTLAAKHTYDDMYKFLLEHPELLSEETVTYMLLHCSDAIKRGKFSDSKRFLKTSQVVKYSLELGKDGVHLFFNK